MSFNFAFANDDIEDNTNGVECNLHSPVSPLEKYMQPTEPKIHRLEELLDTLPSKISYSTFQVPGNDGLSINIPRRELFDIRTQLMAEDQMSGQTNIAGYPVDDIVPNLYEGGFKTWECAVDLAQYLHKNIRQGIDPRDPVRHFIEVGAGTALPTLVLFNHFLMDPNPDWSEIRFWFADYNPSVIETTTVPNLLLTWHFARAKETLQNEGELEITDSLLSHFLMDLSSMAINLTGISGAWGDSFCDLVKPCNDRRGQQSVVFLASETIYSLHSIRPFTEVLVRTLNSARNAEARATALVAAKRMYFGVGGGTDEFLKILGEYKGRAVPVWEPESPGVGRVILEISEDT